ncbi:chromate resistance protein ChrB domain-containing protein [Edaphobacter aggregans]|uniref:chromate resistance protein ChrB domain-containing protein n=1 Tax=Edaphobacter aggregans TaxID=570835 RepID=UPI000A078BB7
MNITSHRESASWLLLIFSLPAKRTSERVGIWRKLQKYGTLALRNSGYVLPNTPANQERLEWLATAIRGFKGEASVLQVLAIDDLPSDVLKEKFREERKPDYTALIRDVQQLKPSTQGFSIQLARQKRRFEEIVEVDFFECQLKAKAEEAIYKAEHPVTAQERVRKGRVSKMEYQSRAWITRPRPGIDRVSSAWLIKRFIDPKASFLFDNNPTVLPEAVPFDMYQAGGFGHEGEKCTFETLCARFGLADKKVRLIGQAIHDADLDDEKFGRTEGITINQILKGWGKQGIPDVELLRRGMELIEGLYHSIA